MTKLTDTQTIILTAGAQRPDNLAMPLPKGLHGAAAKMAVAKMISHGWLQEVTRSSTLTCAGSPPASTAGEVGHSLSTIAMPGGSAG